MSNVGESGKPPAPSSGSPFPNTSWSLVARAGDVRSSVRRRTLEALVRQYQPALRSYLMARRRIGRQEADDLLQGFLASKVLDQQILRRADQARGKFRTFLMTALERFAISEYRKASAARRSPAGAAPVASLEGVDDADHPVAREGADLFDVEWAKQAVEVAVGRMRRECDAGGRADVWGVFKARVLDPSLADAEPVPYERLVPELGLSSAEQASNLLATAKRMFGRNLREVAAEYADDDDAAEEVRRLKQILSAPRA
jgi:RNA polymerase sigma-70 factor (ECF subfamily)